MAGLKVKYEKLITHCRYSSTASTNKARSHFTIKGKVPTYGQNPIPVSSAASDMKYVQSCIMLLLDGSPM